MKLDTAPLHGLAPAPVLQPARGNDAAAIAQAAKGFEELFLGLLLKSGRAASLGEDIAGSNAVTATRDMLDAQLAREGAQRAGFGIAEAVARQFSPNLHGKG